MTGTNIVTSFDVLITAHVVRPTAELFVERLSSGIELNNLAGLNERNMIRL